MMTDIINDIINTNNHIYEIANAITEYKDYLNGKGNNLLLRQYLTDTYDFDSIGYSVDDELRELTEIAVVILTKRLAVLARKNVNKTESLALLCEMEDEDEEESV